MRYGEKCRLLKANWDGYSDALCALRLPMLPADRNTSHLQKESGNPFGESLQFIVIAVMSVIPLYLWGILHDGELRVYLGTVMSSSCSSSLIEWLM
jgi:hypothetical protein